MLDVVLLSGFIVIVIAVNRWLKSATNEHEKTVENNRDGNTFLILIPFTFVLLTSCDGNSSSAANSSDTVTEVEQPYEVYVTQADIDSLNEVIPDSLGKCFSARAYGGMKLFMKNCNVCHPAGEQGKGPSLVDMKYLPDWLIHFQVRTGRGDMPRFTKEQISNEDVKKIVLFVQTMREDSPEDKEN